MGKTPHPPGELDVPGMVVVKRDSPWRMSDAQAPSTMDVRSESQDRGCRVSRVAARRPMIAAFVLGGIACFVAICLLYKVQTFLLLKQPARSSLPSRIDPTVSVDG